MMLRAPSPSSRRLAAFASRTALGAALLLAGASGCKPDNEPSRRLPASPVEAPVAGPLDTLPQAGEPGGLPLAGVPDAGGDAAAVPTDPEEARLATLRAEPSPEALETARLATESARRLHRKLNVEAAVADYRKALEAWPGSPEATYGLAGALALLGDADGAIARLGDLAALESQAAQNLLAAATRDPDFEGLADRGAFRRLTGYLPVTVSWAAGGDRGAASTQVEELREAGVPATVGQAWADPVTETLVLYRADVAGAAALAESARKTLGASATRAVTELDASRPVVVVLAPSEAGDAAAPPPTAGTVTDYVGPLLRATVGGAVEELQLKATGFFTWERAEAEGKRVKRTGRYMLGQDGRLHIDFRQTTETPTADPLAPDVVVEQGRRSTHQMAVVPGGVTVDGTPFQPAAP